MKYTGQKLIMLAGLFVLVSGISSYAQHASHTVIKGGSQVIISKSANNNFRVEYDGDIEVTVDDKDIRSISDNGYIEISKTVFGNNLYILIEEQGGGLYREYRDGRVKMDWEPKGREWLAEILPDIVRSTTIAAQSRVDRYFRQGGTESVLGEIRRLEGDYVRAHYFDLLLKKSGLTGNDLARIAEAAGNEVDSDYYLSKILKDNRGLFFRYPLSKTAYLRAAANIDSDHYASEIFIHALKNKDLNGEDVEAILEAAQEINSDHYLSNILKATLVQDNLTDQMINAIIHTSEEINSDHYQSELYKELLQHKPLSQAAYRAILDAVGDISSDHYLTEILTLLLDENEMTDALVDEIANLVEDEVSSDHYAATILTEMLERDLSDAAFKSIMGSVGEISSDHYTSEILKQVSKRQLSKGELLSYLQAVREISSDHYASEVLVAIAGQVKGADAEVRDAYDEAAEGISSDTYLGRVMRAVRD